MVIGCHLYVPDMCNRNFYVYVGVKKKLAGMLFTVQYVLNLLV